MSTLHDTSPHASAPRYDLAVIGSGPAAATAAMAARGRGKTVALVERGAYGGVCPNTGCVPSKLLISAAAARADAGAGRFPGIATSAGPVDMRTLIEDKRGMIARLPGADADLARARGVEMFQGTASFSGGAGGELPVLSVAHADGTHTEITAEHVLIATGAEPLIPAIDGLSDVGYLTSTTAMELDRVPESLLVIGANAVGLEQAQILSRLGATVTVIDIAPRIAPREDAAVSAALEEALTDEGISFRTGVTPVRVAPSGDQVVLTVDDGTGTSTLSAERLLVATGRRPVTDPLDLKAAGLETGPAGEVVVDEHQRTAHPRIWAAGDVTGRARQFEYVAVAQAELAVANAFDGDGTGTLDYRYLPHVTFTSPAAAGVGLTEEQARESDRPYEIRVLPLAHIGRTMVSRRPHGMVKLVSDGETDRLLGVHIVGDEAGEIIVAAGYALEAGFTVARLARAWSPFLTMGESLKIAAQQPAAMSA
ncbi:Mercuric reductase [Streptomyces sp. enrichment culture]|uniref:dihydrolipoyl dehydrogenase family protein n=1 Tax=Streptomyces sp. enrichment culture TaxID=1795815 RepID=UPI003F576183